VTTADTERHAGLAGLPVPSGLRRSGIEDLRALSALADRVDRRLSGRPLRTTADLARAIPRPVSRHWVRERPGGEADAWVAVQSFDGMEHAMVRMMLDAPLDDRTGEEWVRFAVAAAHVLAPDRPVHLELREQESDLYRWAVAAGGVAARRFGRMELALDPAGSHAAAPVPPVGITVRTLTDTETDWRILYDVIEMAFRDHFGHVPQTYEQYVAEDRAWVEDYSLCWLASVEGAPAAALLGKQRPGVGYVGVLGTRREFRARGLGALLLGTAFTEFARRGETRAALNVDLSSPTGAVSVYERAGMTLAEVEVAIEWPAAA
jgi:GNAT superfamily N-acetyltransferase